MPKATRANDGTTPKKRSRKTTPVVGNGTQPENGSDAQAAQPVTTPQFAHASQASPVVEEKIRTRAYELYLQRGGVGGSPEQDWLRAKEEVCGQQRTA
ncbi:MAG: DUF2934 domain-containing protein [Candidatus Korobacteraceae bacterium]|jgi:hypothetical protein